MAFAEAISHLNGPAPGPAHDEGWHQQPWGSYTQGGGWYHVDEAPLKTENRFAGLTVANDDYPVVDLPAADDFPDLRATDATVAPAPSKPRMKQVPRKKWKRTVEEDCKGTGGGLE